MCSGQTFLKRQHLREMLHLARVSTQIAAGNLTCLSRKGLASIQHHVHTLHWAEQLCKLWQPQRMLSCGHPSTRCPLAALQQGPAFISERDAQNRAWYMWLPGDQEATKGSDWARDSGVAAAHPGRGQRWTRKFRASGGVWVPMGNRMSSSRCPALHGRDEHGGNPDPPHSQAGVAAFLRIEILELGPALRLFLILEPEALERDRVLGRGPGKRGWRAGVSRCWKTVSSRALSSFSLFSPSFEPRAQPLRPLLVGMGSALGFLLGGRGSFHSPWGSWLHQPGGMPETRALGLNAALGLSLEEDP